jgi:hypothetical protein
VNIRIWQLRRKLRGARLETKVALRKFISANAGTRAPRRHFSGGLAQRLVTMIPLHNVVALKAQSKGGDRGVTLRSLEGRREIGAKCGANSRANLVPESAERQRKESKKLGKTCE